jgi:hypothetical protein
MFAYSLGRMWAEWAEFDIWDVDAAASVATGIGYGALVQLVAMMRKKDWGIVRGLLGLFSIRG